MNKSLTTMAMGILCSAFLTIMVQSSVAATEAKTEKRDKVLKAYGPGGPAPAMREAAKVFESKNGIKVEINAGPTSKWKDQAIAEADIIYSGSEYMMTDFQQKDLEGLIDPATVRTLYLRPSAILVRPGNPKAIQGVSDLAKPGVRILVVQGAGQVGMWEDVAGRTANVQLVDAVRRNIGTFAPNSAEAKKIWASDAAFDAWLIWTIWQKEDPAAADLIPTEPENTIYRSCGISTTLRSKQKKEASQFADFLQSTEGKEIFVKWGWIAP